MKYNREKIEAAKILFAEVLELDEKLPENKRVSASFYGGYHGFISVDFFECNEEGIFQRAEGLPHGIGCTLYGEASSENNPFAKVSAVLKDWEERYCKNENT